MSVVIKDRVEEVQGNKGDVATTQNKIRESQGDEEDLLGASLYFVEKRTKKNAYGKDETRAVGEEIEREQNNADSHRDPENVMKIITFFVMMLQSH